jgi:hypothetical protein
MSDICQLIPRDRSARWVEELPVEVRLESGKGARDASWTPDDIDRIEQTVAEMALRDDDTGRSLRALSERRYYRFVQWVTGKDYGELHPEGSVDGKARSRAQKMARGGSYKERGPYNTKKKKDAIRLRQGVQ